MPICKNCGRKFPARIKIDGKTRLLTKRKYCLVCSPFGEHNTYQLSLGRSKPPKYTREDLQKAVDNSVSVVGVLAFLGIRLTGRNHSRISLRIKELGLDTSRLLGRSANRGRVFLSARRKASEVLTLWKKEREFKADRVRRAMVEIGIEYKCLGCGTPPLWMGKELVLQIDHINGSTLDSRPENVRFLCPNCHSQTKTWGIKNRSPQ